MKYGKLFDFNDDETTSLKKKKNYEYKLLVIF